MTKRYSKHPRLLLGLALLTALAARARAEDACNRLRHITITPDQIGFATSGATVNSAHEHRLGSMPYCRVMGRIHPIDPTANDIRFELNLPERWNAKALQYGGGTFDGYLRPADGLGRTAVETHSLPVPLERGYATFGSDGGHHHNYFPLPDAINSLNAKFARNAEMQSNFDGDQLKKVHDTAIALLQARYGKVPRRMYFIGGSTGGREAMRVAQRFPTDYDGVLAAYAALDQIELDLQFMRTAQALYAPGGFLHPAQTAFIERTVEAHCDAADGLRDHIVSDPAACRVPKDALACSEGHHPHGCLKPAQMHTLETFATRQRTAMPLSNGVDSIAGYNVLAGADLKAAVGLLPFGLRDPVFLLNSFGYVIGDDVTRNFLPVGHHFDSRKFDTVSGGPWHDQLIDQARRIDSTDANLQPFFAHGGKLILVHGTTDTVIPTNSSVDYYERVRQTLGADAAERSMRLYLVPGLGHGFGRFNGGFDTVGTLDEWVEHNLPPHDLVVTDSHGGRTRPLCDYPAWPRYTGSGDPNAAASFTCAQPSSTVAATAPQQ